MLVRGGNVTDKVKMAATRIFSGIQPTGVPHLGNYLGALRNWVKLQHSGQVLYSVVDLHAITAAKDPTALRQAIRGTAAALLACGVDAKRSVVFQQSQVPQHSELAWILTCHTPLGWLRRMTQFKTKATKQQPGVNADQDASVFSSNVNTGLLCYPTLMAADILLYSTTHVPVGEDQTQHVELTRNIARAFNSKYGRTVFVEPQTVIGAGKRVMSLRDGRVKMSKSDESDFSRINLDDSDDIIASKVSRAKTDSIPSITWEPETRPEVANLLTIFDAMGDNDDAAPGASAAQFTSTAQFKKALAERIVARIRPIRSELERLQRDPSYLDSILRDGAQQARHLAATKLAEVHQTIGFS